MDNPEKTEGEIKNGQSRDIVNKRQTTEGAIKNGQFRDTGKKHKTNNEDKQNTKNTSQKTKMMSNIDLVKNRGVHTGARGG